MFSIKLIKIATILQFWLYKNIQFHKIPNSCKITICEKILLKGLG